MNDERIVLSPENLAFAADRATAAGQPSASEYVDSLVRSERLKQLRSELDAKLLEGLQEEYDPEADDFLEQLESSLRARAKGVQGHGSKSRRT